MQRRNKLLLSSKRDLIKICKQNNISTKGCLAKMDFVGKILQNEKNKAIKKNKKGKNKNKKKAPNTNKKKPKKTPNKKKVTTPKINIVIDSPKIKNTDIYSSSDDSDYSSGSSSSISLKTPEYIPARMSLTEVFDINIFQNEYKEKKARKKNIKWGYSPHPSDDIVINQNRDSVTSTNSTVSDLSVIDDNCNNIPKFKPSNSMGIILDDEDANDQDYKEQKTPKYIKNVLESDPFKRIDAALGAYYKYFDRDDYFDDDGKGKFIIFCEKTQDLLDENKITEQFIENVDKDPQNCPYLVFDDKFPLILMQNEKEDKEKERKMKLVEIYNVMEYCYHHGQSPYF